MTMHKFKSELEKCWDNSGGDRDAFYKLFETRICWVADEEQYLGWFSLPAKDHKLGPGFRLYSHDRLIFHLECIASGKQKELIKESLLRIRRWRDYQVMVSFPYPWDSFLSGRCANGNNTEIINSFFGFKIWSDLRRYYANKNSNSDFVDWREVVRLKFSEWSQSDVGGLGRTNAREHTRRILLHIFAVLCNGDKKAFMLWLLRLLAELKRPDIKIPSMDIFVGGQGTYAPY